MYESQYVIEDVTNPDDIARFRAQDARHRRNSEWLQTHWAEGLSQARGKFVAVAGQEAFIADTPAEAWAWVDAMHPEGNGALVRYIRPEEGPRSCGSSVSGNCATMVSCDPLYVSKYWKERHPDR